MQEIPHHDKFMGRIAQPNHSQCVVSIRGEHCPSCGQKTAGRFSCLTKHPAGPPMALQFNDVYQTILLHCRTRISILKSVWVPFSLCSWYSRFWWCFLTTIFPRMAVLFFAFCLKIADIRGYSRAKIRSAVQPLVMCMYLIIYRTILTSIVGIPQKKAETGWDSFYEMTHLFFFRCAFMNKTYSFHA